MKVSASVKVMCRNCRVIRRNGSVRIICSSVIVMCINWSVILRNCSVRIICSDKRNKQRQG